jgi:hypothetical protein
MNATDASCLVETTSSIAGKFFLSFAWALGARKEARANAATDRDIVTPLFM